MTLDTVSLRKLCTASSSQRAIDYVAPQDLQRALAVALDEIDQRASEDVLTLKHYDEADKPDPIDLLSSCDFVGEAGCSEPTCQKCHGPHVPNRLERLANFARLVATGLRYTTVDSSIDYTTGTTHVQYSPTPMTRLREKLEAAETRIVLLQAEVAACHAAKETSP